jgi:hypothetical protein
MLLPAAAIRFPAHAVCSPPRRRSLKGGLTLLFPAPGAVLAVKCLQNRSNRELKPYTFLVLTISAMSVSMQGTGPI